MVIEVPIDFDFHRLKKDVLHIVEHYGPKPWLVEQEDWYSGIGLTYNPEIKKDKLQHALGMPDKSDIWDCQKFTIFTEAGIVLKWFFDLIPMQPIKSRIAIVDANKWKLRAGWHRDEPITENLRLNVPILTNDNFGIQLDNQKPIILHPGKCYSWDTGNWHRPWCSKAHDFIRISLVLGFNPKNNLGLENWMIFNK